MEKKTYDVIGMHCVSCSMAISKLLKKNKDVEDVEVALGESKITVSFNPEAVNDQVIADTVARLGYKATPARNVT